jgi:hypothetical protein
LAVAILGFDLVRGGVLVAFALKVITRFSN